MKGTKILLFLMLLGVVFSAGKCKKKDKDEATPGLVGTWKINSILNSANATPPNLTNLVNGTAVFGNTDYEFKNASGTGVESGSYVYTASAGTLAVTPSGTSVFTNSNAAYNFNADLASPNLQLRVNIAAPNKPANEITISLTKQQ
ncbi:MAG: hypothetical protein Fur0027_15160 [Raineya sp.]